ncbi:MAG: M23 family metallopeptidase [Rhodobacteraceae bacterium]|nr:M23 family metallopeptidase [Paracoccaceae bacterium]
MSIPTQYRRDTDAMQPRFRGVNLSAFEAIRGRFYPAALAFLGLAGCSGGLPDKGAFAPYVSQYPAPISVTMPASAPTITQQFRAPDVGSLKGQKWSEHNGLDVHAPVGTPVISAAPGRVTQSYLDPAYGHVILIEHAKGHQTRYAHLSERIAAKGDSVARGQKIGTLGRSGALSGGFPHLHFEFWKTTPTGRRATDPHEGWIDGVGQVTCYTLRRRAPRTFGLTYPVPCQ